MISISEIIIFIILFILSGFFSGSETALVSVKELKLREKANNNNQKAMIVQELLETPDKLLSTILIGNNLVNITLTSFTTAVIVRLFGQAGVGISIGFLTILMLVFAEIIPKTYAAVNADRFALHVAKPIRLLEKLVEPLVLLLSSVASQIIKLAGGDPNKQENIITRTEIKNIVNIGQTQGTIHKDEREMIRNVFDLNKTIIREVMVPRVDITALSVDTSMDTLL